MDERKQPLAAVVQAFSHWLYQFKYIYIYIWEWVKKLRYLVGDCQPTVVFLTSLWIFIGLTLVLSRSTLGEVFAGLGGVKGRPAFFFFFFSGAPGKLCFFVLFVASHQVL